MDDPHPQDEELFKGNMNQLVIEAIAPALIMILVSSLVFFLIEVFYQDIYDFRLMYIFGLFVFAAVLVARISIDEGRGYAAFFAIPLGLATWLVASTFIEVDGPLKAASPLLTGFFILIVWFWADRLTWDCTVVDFSKDVSNQGLLETVAERAMDVRDTVHGERIDEPETPESPERPAAEPATTPVPNQNLLNPLAGSQASAGPQASAGTSRPFQSEPARPFGHSSSQESLRDQYGLDSKGNPTRGAEHYEANLYGTSSKSDSELQKWWQRLPIGRRRANSPGVWVIYLTLAAIPIFGFGQAFIPAADSPSRRYAFLLFLMYTFAGLGLLLTTSLLSLQRYLRKRELTLPNPIAVTWVITGGIGICVILAVVWILPRPAPEYSVLPKPISLSSSDDLKPSRRGIGKDGEKEAPGGATQSNRQSQSSQGQSNGRGSSGGRGQGNSSSGQSSGQRGQGGGGSRSGSRNSNSQSQQSGRSGSNGQNSSGQSSRGQSSRGQSSRGQSSQGQGSRGQSSQGQGSRGQQGSSSSQGANRGSNNEQQSGNQSQNSGNGQSGNRDGNQTQSDQQNGQGSQSSSNRGGPNDSSNNSNQNSGNSNNSSGQRNSGQGNSGRGNSGSRGGQSNRGGSSVLRDSQANSDSSDRQEQTQQNSGSSQSNQSSSTPSASQIGAMGLGLLGTLLKFFMIVLLIGVAIFVFWKYRDQIKESFAKFVDEIRKLLAKLFGWKLPERKKKDGEPELTAPVAPPKAFTEFLDPYETGSWENQTVPQLVGYSFQAFEAWGRDRQCPREADQTPSEFARHIGRMDKQVGPVAKQMAELYSQVAYAKGQASPASHDLLRKFWITLRQRYIQPQSTPVQSPQLQSTPIVSS